MNDDTTMSNTDNTSNTDATPEWTLPPVSAQSDPTDQSVPPEQPDQSAQAPAWEVATEANSASEQPPTYVAPVYATPSTPEQEPASYLSSAAPDATTDYASSTATTADSSITAPVQPVESAPVVIDAEPYSFIDSTAAEAPMSSEPVEAPQEYPTYPPYTPEAPAPMPDYGSPADAYAQPYNPTPPLSQYDAPQPAQQNYYAPPQAVAPAVVVVQQQQAPSNTLPVILEVVLGLFGIYGVGWLVAKHTTPGIILLVCSVVWWLIAAVIIVFTVGFGLICVWPIDIAALITSAVLLSRQPVRA